MNWNHKLRRITALAVGLFLAVSGLALAQGGGSLYGTVTDEKDQRLPGVTVTLSGGNVPAVQVTDAQGDFRFLNLAPGSYKLEAALEGFSNVVLESAIISLGRNTNVEVKMSSVVTDVVTVTGETPLIDERKVSTGANVNFAELTKVPSAKDPWTVLQTVPGVLVDRINVGGNESGQQSSYVSPGATGTQSQWTMDGTSLTDFGAQGSTTYFDFDSFEEMSFSTGGSDATKATPGVSTNIVTRRGTNAYRFEGNYTVTSDSWQSDNEPTGSDLGPGQPSFNRGNRIDHIQKRNLQLSGPLWKDHLWLWASYGVEQINKLNPAGAGFSKDQTQLKSKNAKLNAQLIDSNSLAVVFFNNDKIKLGRNIGLLAQSSWTVGDPNATADQGAPPSWDKPTLQKVEDTQIFGSNFFLTGTYAKIDGSFGFTPKGGDAIPFFDADKNLFNNSFLYEAVRPSKMYNLDGSYFFNTGSTSHELKFGAGYRKSDVQSTTGLTGGGFVTSDANFCLIDCDPDRNLFVAVRDGAFNYRAKNTSAYAQDTISWGNFTANVGLRYDKQEGFGLPGAVGANTWAPDVLGAQATLALDGASWTDITPRLGLTYALGADKKTLLRASYSRYADGLGPAGAYWNIVGFFGGYTYAYFYYNDAGAAGRNFDPAKIGAIVPGQQFFPPATESYTRIDPDLKAPTTDELVLSVEHALLPEFTVAANLTYSKYHDPLQFFQIVGDGFVPGPGEGRRATTADYDPVSVTLANGRTVTVYKLKPNIGQIAGITEMGNGNYGRTYKGLTLVGTKRLSNRWMLRGNLSFSDWTYDVKSDSFPNRTVTAGQGTAVRDGDQVIAPVGGSGKPNIYVNSKWSYSFTGLYQVMPDRPWGFDVGATLYGRQGFPYAETQTVAAGLQGLSQLPYSPGVQTTVEPDSKRLDNIRLLDVRLSKEVSLGHFGGTVAFDLFNVTNENTGIARNRTLTSSQRYWITEQISPRVFRLGLTVYVQ